MDSFTTPPPGLQADLDLDAIGALRAALWGAGYRPLAVYSADSTHEYPGKAPQGRGWETRARQTPPEAASLPAVRHAANTGILCDGLRAVDIDVDAPEPAGRVRDMAAQMLGTAPLRFRENSGRCLMVYRAAVGEPKKRVLSGVAGKIEVLGHGQQFVAFGTHPTGAALRWHPAPLQTVARDTLPAVTEDQVTAFLAAAGPLIGAEAPQAGPADHEPPQGAGVAPTDILDVTAALAAIPNRGAADWEHWNKVGMAAWAASGGSAHGFNAWAAWSATHDAHDINACRARWEHYPTSPPDRTGSGKLYRLAADAVPGWRRPSEAVASGTGRSDPPEIVPPLRPLTAAEFLSLSIAPRALALSPILPLPGLGMLYGPRGLGKTYIGLTIAYAMAAGENAPALRWNAPAARRVLYVDGEMPAGALQERLAAIVRGAPYVAPADGLRFVCADLLPDGLPSIARPAMQRAVTEAAADADVLILDNLSSLAGGLRENEADDWQPIQTFLMALRRAGKHVLIVHHAGKGGQQRGTSRREDVLDTVIALRRPADYEPDQGARVEVHLEKSRGMAGPEASPFEARLTAAPDGGLTWSVTDLRDANRDKAEGLLAEGMSIRDVAEETGLSRSAVHRLKKAAGRGGDA